MKKNSSPRFHSEVFQSLTNPKATLRPSVDPPVDMAKMDTSDSIQIVAWEVAFNDESQPSSAKVAATADEDLNIKHGSRFTDNLSEENEELNAQEESLAIKELLVTEMTTMVEEMLYGVLCKTFIACKVASDLSYITSLSR